jgi:hypothetical protein
MPNKMAERRRTPRFPLILMAEVIDLVSGAKVTARTSDVSRAGCYLDTLHPVPLGSVIQIRLSREGETFEVTGKVVYVNPGLGMGVSFDKQTPSDQLALLDRWLERAARLPV